MRINKLFQIRNMVSTLLFIFCFQVYAAKPNAPYHVRCVDKTNPVGTTDHPYFGWFTADSDNNDIQSAYQIIVSSSKAKLSANIGDVWQGDTVSSRQQNYIYYNGAKLSAATQYFWKVRTWDKDGNVSPYSSAATFATGLFLNTDWAGAHWIKRNTQEPDDYTYYRKNFTLPNKKIKRATIYITACHSYELTINGKRIGKGFNHHYPAYSYYHAWDISSFLSQNNENILACLTHWYGGGQGRAKGSRGLLIKTVIEYTDASSTIIVSDKTWKQTQASQWTTHQPQRNSEGVGRIEQIDSRKRIQDWDKISFNDSHWSNAYEIGPQPTAPWTGTLRPDLTRVKETEMKPVSITQLPDNTSIIDLGKIYSGSFKITFKGGLAGDTIKMLGGFVLNNDGTVSKKISQKTKLNFTFIHNGKTAVFKPNVYLGLRYLQVNNPPNTLTKNNVSFIKRHYELVNDATFESSDSTLNGVWDLMVHSLMVGAQEGFVDTPTREKGAFLGDSWSQGVPCMSVLYDRTMNLKSLHEFLDSQNQFWPDGRINAVYPNGDGARDIPDFTQSYLLWVWDYYMQTGNKEFLKSNYEQLKKVADYVDAYKNDSTGLIHYLKGGKNQYEFGIIDWPIDMRYGYDMGVASRTVINAYAYADFKTMYNIANALEKSADKAIYMEKANEMKKAINTHLINKNGVYIDGIYDDGTQSKHVSQHANALPLAFGIVPNKFQKQVVREIKNRKMNVGMICLRWLPEAIGKANEGEHLFNLYTNTTWDGWAKNIEQGATVTWESWNAIEKNESLSHPWGAVGLLAMQNYILGIKALSPQLDTIQIKPLDFGTKLTYAKGTYKTDKGTIFVHWKRNQDKYTLLINIPNNITAKVYIPKCNKTTNHLLLDNKKCKGVSDGDYIFMDNIGSGEHIFER